MQNLSGLAANSLTASSMAAGNMTSSNETAMTAPGTEPVDPLPDREHQGDPHVTPLDHARTVLVPDGPRGHATAPVPWTQADGSPWVQAADDAGPQPHLSMIRRGEWNQL